MHFHVQIERRSFVAALAMGSACVMLPSTVVAMFAASSDDELIQRSSLIVLGTWVGQTELRLQGMAETVALGVISVSETLKGTAGQSLVFVAVPKPGAPRSGSDILYRRGDQGLWLLHSQPGAPTSVYLADHPQRFVSAASASARIETLRKALTKR